MGLQTAAGAAIAISAASPATQDAAGYGALAFTTAGNCEKIGTIGATFAKVEFQPLVGAKQKLKGSADYGSLQPSFAIDSTDAGQTLFKTAAADTTNLLYAFKVTLQDGTKRFFQGRVFGWPENIDTADSIAMATPTVEICTVVITAP